MAQVPQLFGAPAPQDTGGPLSSLMSTQMRGAELAVQSAQQAVAQTVQALQFGMQLRARKDEQLREIEAQGTLERVRQQASDERARLEREQQDRQFKASQRLDRQRGMMDFRLRSKGLELDSRQLDAQVGHQDRMFGLQKAQVESGIGLDRIQGESALESLRQGRAAFEQQRMAERQKALAYEFAGTLMRELPDGTIEPQFERIMPFLQQLQGTPYNAETQDTARDPNAAANIGSELERMAGGRNERAMKRTDQATDILRATAAGRGGEAELPVATGPQRVNFAAIESISKAAPQLSMSGALGAVGTLASEGRLVFDADTGTFGVLGGAAEPETMLALKRLEDAVRTKPTLGIGLAGAGAFPGAPASVQWDAGRSIYNATGFGARAPQQQMPQGQAPVQQSPQQPQAPAQPQADPRSRFVDSFAAPEAPPGSGGGSSSFLAVKQPTRGGRYRGSQDTPPPGGASRAAPSRSAARPRAANEELHRLIGGARGDGAETLGRGSPLGKAHVRERLASLARTGSSDAARVATLARQLGHITEAEMQQFQRQAADAARAKRPR